MNRRRGAGRTVRTAARTNAARGKGRSVRRRPRVGDRRRRRVLALSVVALAGSMLVSVRRGAEGTRLAESLTELGREERVLSAQLAEEMIRVDSLGSWERILLAAADLGLRVAKDDEVLHVPDVARPATDEER